MFVRLCYDLEHTTTDPQPITNRLRVSDRLRPLNRIRSIYLLRQPIYPAQPIDRAGMWSLVFSPRRDPASGESRRPPGGGQGSGQVGRGPEGCVWLRRRYVRLVWGTAGGFFGKF